MGACGTHKRMVLERFSRGAAAGSSQGRKRLGQVRREFAEPARAEEVSPLRGSALRFRPTPRGSRR